MNIIPFPYAIPDKYVLTSVPEKTQLFAELIPGTTTNYMFGQGEQEAYYKHYQSSRFAKTQKKGGWDCLRHYEILMNGCIPVFENLEHCPTTTMVTFPKELVLSAINDLLPWEETPERISLYNSYVLKLLEHTRNYCTISALTNRFISYMPSLLTDGKPDPSKKILMINGCPGVNYSRELLSIGLRQFYGENFIEYPRNTILYDDCDTTGAYGNGYTYSGHLDSTVPVNRTSSKERILNHTFDVVLYGKMGADEGPLGTYSTTLVFEYVKSVYDQNDIAFLYGGDGCQSIITHWYNTSLHLWTHAKLGRCFVRELEIPTLCESLWKLFSFVKD